MEDKPLTPLTAQKVPSQKSSFSTNTPKLSSASTSTPKLSTASTSTSKLSTASTSTSKLSSSSSASNKLSSSSPESGGRLKGIQIIKPIVYGNVAWYLGEKRQEDGHTHQWNVYLKAYDNEDMSVYVKRVHFKLHESYADPNRVCHAPPYGVTETGWGEFEVAIKIFFHDSNERPVTIYHFLKLFDREKDGNVKMSTVPVNSEFYDELVFADPTVKMHKLLTHPKLSTPEQQHNTDYEEKKARDLEKILTAKQKVKNEIAELKARLAEAKDNISKLKSNAS